MPDVLETLVAERKQIATELRDLATKAEKENGGVFDDALLHEVEVRKAAFVEKSNLINRHKSLRATQSEIDNVLSAEDAEALNNKALDGTVLGLLGKSNKTVGTRFTESDAYKALLSRYPGGISETTKGIRTDPVQVGGLKALLTGADHDTSAGALVRPDYLGVVPFPTVRPNIRQLITTGTTTSDKVEYAQVLPYTAPGGSVNNAAPVPEATDVTGTSGTKPQSDIRFRKASADIITVAHWIPATKRALSDAAQLRTLIDSFLRDGVDREIQRLILSGDRDNPLRDDTEEWDGILNTEGVQAVEFDTDLFVVARRIISRVAAVGGNVTGFAVSPATGEALDLVRDQQGRFYGNGPFALGPNTLWGRPRLDVVDLPDGVIIGGEWSTCVLWDRESTTLTATDAHADFFVRNLIAVLAEARAGFAVLNPQLLAVGETAAA